MGKRDHLKDYVPSENGGYEYTGTRWSWPSEEVRSEFIGFSARRVGVAVACVIAAGCVPADGTFGAFYIVIPFLIAVVGMALAGAALFRIAREDNPMRDHVYSSSVPALPAKLLVGAPRLRHLRLRGARPRHRSSRRRRRRTNRPLGCVRGPHGRRRRLPRPAACQGRRPRVHEHQITGPNGTPQQSRKTGQRR